MKQYLHSKIDEHNTEYASMNFDDFHIEFGQRASRSQKAKKAITHWIVSTDVHSQLQQKNIDRMKSYFQYWLRRRRARVCSFALCLNAEALILYSEHNYKWNKCASRPSIVNRTYSVHLFFCFNSHIISNLPCAHRDEWQNYTQKYHYWWPCTAMRSRLQQSIVHSNVSTMDDASVRQTAKVHEWRNRTENRTFSTDPELDFWGPIKYFHGCYVVARDLGGQNLEFCEVSHQIHESWRILEMFRFKRIKENPTNFGASTGP